MTANVRCVGQPSRTDPPKGIPPCGWTGERYTQGATIYTGDGTAENPLRYDLQADWKGDLEARTRKPCPRCGGKVENHPLADWP